MSESGVLPSRLRAAPNDKRTLYAAQVSRAALVGYPMQASTSNPKSLYCKTQMEAREVQSQGMRSSTGSNDPAPHMWGLSQRVAQPR